jgi:hypothetical protein
MCMKKHWFDVRKKHHGTGAQTRQRPRARDACCGIVIIDAWLLQPALHILVMSATATQVLHTNTEIEINKYMWLMMSTSHYTYTIIENTPTFLVVYIVSSKHTFAAVIIIIVILCLN